MGVDNIYLQRPFYLDWDWCPFDEAEDKLPDAPGVYIVTKEKAQLQPTLIYIGQSTDLYKRWKGSHEATSRSIELGATTIRYFLTDKMRSLEKILINHLKPVLNKQHVNNLDTSAFRFVPSEWNEEYTDRRDNPSIKALEALMPFF
jgi:excinuclease UvrABC nuclease subunit